MRFTNVAVWVRDPREVGAWYEKHLGFRRATETPRFVLLEGDGDAAIAFHEGDALANPSSVQLHVEVDDLDAQYDTMKANGVVFDGEPADRPWGVRSVACADPAGHSVEIVQAPGQSSLPT